MKRLLALIMAATLLFAVGCPSPTSSGDDDIAVTEFTLDYDQVGLALDKGDTFEITATVSPDNATNKNVTWATLNEAVVTVENGLLTAVNPGDTYIVVYPDGAPSLVKAISVHVDEVKTDVTGVELDLASLTLKETATAQLAATITPADATNQAVSWESDNTAVATVSTSGLVTAVAEGSATITVTTADNGRSATCEVTVEALDTTVPVDSVTISSASYTVDLKNATSVQLSAEVLPADATNKAVTWESDDTDVALVNATGLVTALAEGTADITVTTADGSIEDTVTITITDSSVAVTGVTLNTNNEDLTVGELLELTATVLPADADNQYVTWSTSNASVATVDNGTVVAEGVGTATITVTTVDGDKTASCDVEVIAATTIEDLITAGVNALKVEDFDGAKEYFDAAYVKDNTNATAALWKALATLVSAAIDEDMQTIASNAGLTNYPTTLNELLSGDFMEEMQVYEYEDYTGGYWDDEAQEWVEFYESVYSYLPQITIPTPDGYDMLNLPSWEDEEGLNVLNSNEYSLSIYYNLAQAYPTGVTAPITSFVGVLTDATDAVTTVLSTVNTSGSISLTPEILGFTEDELDFWPMENGTDYVPQVVGAAEFKAVNGAIKIMNALFTYALSVSYDMDTQAYMDHFLHFYTTDSTDWASLPAHPMKEMLVQQSNSALTDSKAYLSSGLADLIDAVDDIQTRTADDSPFSVSAAEQPADIWSEILNGAKIADVFLTNLKTSLDEDGTTVCIPFTAWTDTTVFDNLTGTVISADGMPEVLEVNISKLFDQSILDPANLVEMDENREPAIYTFGAEGTSDPSAVTSQTAITEGVYGFKGLDYTLGGLLVIEEADITAVLSGQMGDSSMVVFDDTTEANDYYVQTPLEAPFVWSALNSLDKEVTYEGETIYGAGSFYWAPLRNFHLFMYDEDEEGSSI